MKAEIQIGLGEVRYFNERELRVRAEEAESIASIAV